MPPKLYATLVSPPVRAVLLCCKAINLDLEWIEVDLIAQKHLEPEFTNINPEHTVPVLDDDGFILVDSHAIMTYLVSKYGKDDSLYPNDLKKRAIVNHRLHFDSSILFTRASAVSKAFIFEGGKNVPQRDFLALEEAISLTEKFLSDSAYVAGDALTVADFSIVTTLTSLSMYVPLDEIKFPKITAWLNRLKDLPYYKEGNQKGLDIQYDLLSKFFSK